MTPEDVAPGLTYVKNLMARGDGKNCERLVSARRPARGTATEGSLQAPLARASWWQKG